MTAAAQNPELAEAAAYLMRAFVWDEHDAEKYRWAEAYHYLFDKGGHEEYCKLVDKLDALKTGKPNAEYCAKAASLIMSNLVWVWTPQGGNFWCQIYGKLCSMAEGCEPVSPSLPVLAEHKPTPVRRRSRFLPDMMHDKLKALGYDVLGSGCYSKVYAHPSEPDFVIKVSSRADDWPAFVKWGEDNGYAGTFTPKVVAMKVFKSGLYIAKMERLDCEVGEKAGTDLYNRYKQMKNLARHGFDDKDCPLERAALEAQRALIEAHQPGTLGFCDAFHTRWGGIATDLHDGNWMVRSGNQIVMTDPITNGGDEVRAEGTGNFRVKSSPRVFAAPLAMAA